MKSNYRKIGEFISQCNDRNEDGSIDLLLGVNLDKKFMPSVANINGTDLTKYKIIRKGQFGCKLMSVGRDKKLPISRLTNKEKAIISTAYFVFEVIDEKKLLSEYLMMWFKRSESDRFLWFLSGGDIRGRITWGDLCSLPIKVPSIEKQHEIVNEYKTITNRIALIEQLNQKLEETAQALYKHWFIDKSLYNFESLGDFVEFNPKHSIAIGEIASYIEMACLQENALSIKDIRKREYKSGTKFKNEDILFARITPCLENGKTGFVNTLLDDEVAYGSTEFIVMRSKQGVSPYWVYCLAREEDFRSYAISSMVGSSGRQRVHSDYLKNYQLNKIDNSKMNNFHRLAKPIFKLIRFQSLEIDNLLNTKDLILSKMTKVEVEEEILTD